MEAKVNDGLISVMVTGEEMVMKPTLEAAITLSSSAGGITGMVERCLNYDFDAIHAVMVAGVGYSSDLKERVYKEGMINLAPRCIEFLHVLANGGRSIVHDEEEEESDDPL